MRYPVQLLNVDIVTSCSCVVMEIVNQVGLICYITRNLREPFFGIRGRVLTRSILYASALPVRVVEHALIRRRHSEAGAGQAILGKRNLR